MSAYEHLGHRTVGLRVGGELLEGRVVQSWHVGLQDQMNRGDLEAAGNLLHGQRGVAVQAFRRMPSPAQLKRRRHAEAARVGGSNQFLGIGAFAVAEA